MLEIGTTAGVLAAVAVVLVVTSTQAQQPTITDAAICNEDAQAKAGAPSASPAIPAPPVGPPTTANAPTLEPKAGTRTDSSGSIIVRSPDPLLEGMATSGLKDPAYRIAYRECMAARLKRR
jgi:hypothetical protein